MTNIIGVQYTTTVYDDVISNHNLSVHSIHSVHTMLQYVLKCTTLIFQTFYTLCSYHAPICPEVYYPHLLNILYTLFIPCSNISLSVLPSSLIFQTFYLFTIRNFLSVMSKPRVMYSKCASDYRDSQRF